MFKSPIVFLVHNTKFQQLFNNCGVHLCLTEAESFSHLINQCKLCKSIPVSFNNSVTDRKHPPQYNLFKV